MFCTWNTVVGLLYWKYESNITPSWASGELCFLGEGRVSRLTTIITVYGAKTQGLDPKMTQAATVYVTPQPPIDALWKKHHITEDIFWWGFWVFVRGRLDMVWIISIACCNVNSLCRLSLSFYHDQMALLLSSLTLSGPPANPRIFSQPNRILYTVILQIRI